MRVLTCQDRYEDKLTALYECFALATKYGHDELRMEVEPIGQLGMFDTYIHVDADSEKVEKVIRSIIRDISKDAYFTVYYAAHSSEIDALDCIRDFLRVAFKVGPKVSSMLTEESVMRIYEIRRKVSNEAHHFKEFVRFSSMSNKVYVAHIEPRSDVVYLVGNYFCDRMPSEHWMIIDDSRKLAVIHPKDQEMSLRYLTSEEYEILKQTEENEDIYQELWKGFFNAISIKQRESHVRQRTMFPIWMRKHAVELK